MSAYLKALGMYVYLVTT